MSDFYHGRIREAKERGYYVTLCGLLYGPKGRIKLSLSPKQKYPTFSTNWGGRVYGLPVHKFAGYFWYGDAALEKGVHVRHMKPDTLDFSKKNLRLGSASDNEQDKPKADRVRVAKIGRSAQGFTPKNAKLTDADVWHIRDEYEKLNGRKAPNGFTQGLVDKFGVSKTVINKIVHRKYYPNAKRPNSS